MIEMFLDVPYWVHIIIGVVTAIILGMICVNKEGNGIDWNAIGPCAVIFIAVFFLWQMLAIILAAVLAIGIPMLIGAGLRIGYKKYYEPKKSDVSDKISEINIESKLSK